jgi:hypothetical protein
MEPAGWLNGARDRAYEFSQKAWRRTRRDGAALQDAADRERERRAHRERLASRGSRSTAEPFESIPAESS